MHDATATEPVPVQEDLSTDQELRKLQIENTRLHRALQALYCAAVEWLEDRPLNPERKIRIGLCDLTSVHGPTLLTVYERLGTATIIRVSGAREWAEGVLEHTSTGPSDKLLQDAARDVLIYLGEHKL